MGAGMRSNKGSDMRSSHSCNNLNKKRGKGLAYQEWIKNKDAEKRMKRKLTTQAQNDIKEQLLVVAKHEREKYEKRCRDMDEWLMRKKIDQAEKVAHMRDLDRQQEIEKQLCEERKTNNYKDWMRLQTMKNKQTRKYKRRNQEQKNDEKARQLAEQEELMRMRMQGQEYEAQYAHMDEMDGEDHQGIDQYQ